MLGSTASLIDAFKAANDVLLGAVQGIADLIIRPGMINVDFADVRTVMSEMGMAMMGISVAAVIIVRVRPLKLLFILCWRVLICKVLVVFWLILQQAWICPWAL